MRIGGGGVGVDAHFRPGKKNTSQPLTFFGVKSLSVELEPVGVRRYGISTVEDHKNPYDWPLYGGCGNGNQVPHGTFPLNSP